MTSLRFTAARSLAISLFVFSMAQGVVLGCRCVAPPIGGPCGKGMVDAPPGSLSFVGTVTSAENPGLARKAADYAKLSRYRFRIDELISGDASMSTVDLLSKRGGGDCAAHFSIGTQYVVHAYQQEDGSWSTSICAHNRLASEAGPYLSQVRATRRGEKRASLYGSLWRRQQTYGTVAQAGYDRRLSNVGISLDSLDGTFKAVTDSDGHYFFYDLPGGTYDVRADLPPGLKLAQIAWKDEPLPIGLSATACTEHDIQALPKAQIRGWVMDPAGVPLTYASLTLYRTELYGRSSLSLPWRESQEDGNPFVFAHVAPGEYLLVFNEPNNSDPDQPFPRTFYGDANDAAHAKRILVSEPDQAIETDIHVKDGRETRQIRVKVVRENGEPDKDSYVKVQPKSGSAPLPREVSAGFYSINVFTEDRYTISVEDMCFTLKRVEGERVTIARADETRELTLRLPRGACPK